MKRCKRQIIIALLLIIPIISLSVHAYEIDTPQGSIKVSQDGLVEDSYIVTFKNPVDNKPPLIEPPSKANRGNVPFGQHSTGQSKKDLAAKLNIRGEIVSIFETINAIHVKMDSKEAFRLSHDPRVLRIDQDRLLTATTTQLYPGWALDRIDEQTAVLDSTYDYTNTGVGRTIYIIDSGLTLANPSVAAEFGGRASVIYDYNGSNGADCFGHGTMVSSVAAGNTKGVAKGATLIIAKVTIGCTKDSLPSTHAMAFNWLAANAPAGTIVNWSHGFSRGYNVCGAPIIDLPLENCMKAAHNAGIIIVVSAGNDNCNTANFSPTRIPEVFVVGATSSILIPAGKDARSWFSRTGWNISAFAPGEYVPVIDRFGNPVTAVGTSLAAPYITGIFAVACQFAEPYCDVGGPAAALYTALRNTGTLNTVTDTYGAPLIGATPRFISQQW